MYLYFVGVLLIGWFMLMVWLKRIQFHSYPVNQGWLLGLGLVPKSSPVGGVRYVVLSLFVGPLEARWFVWRWGRARS